MPAGPAGGVAGSVASQAAGGGLREDPDGQALGDSLGPGWRRLQGRSAQCPTQVPTLSRRIFRQRHDNVQFEILKGWLPVRKRGEETAA